MASPELIYDDDCPNVTAARGNLRAALLQAGLPPTWTEWRIGGEVPERARGYGSPTILVGGKDVVGSQPSGDQCCRVYRGSDGLQGVPTVDAIVRALGRPRSGRWALGGAVMAGALSSACCWLPMLLLAVGGTVTGLGAFFESARPYFLAGAVLMVIIAAAVSPRRRRRWTLAVGTVGVALLAGLPELLATTAESAEGAQAATGTHYAVAGMTCAGCEALLRSELMRIPGVTSAEVSHPQSRAIVAGAYEENALQALADELGYRLTRQ